MPTSCSRRAARSRPTRWSSRTTSTRSRSCAGKRLYLPQQDSLRSYVAKGLLTESGVKLGQFSKVTYGNTSGGGLVALSFDMADVTVADEAQAKEWIAAASRPGAHPEDDAAGSRRHEHGRAQGLLRHRMRPTQRLGQLARRRDSRASAASASPRPTPAVSSPTSPRSASPRPTRSRASPGSSAEQVAELGQAGRDASSTPARRRNTTTSTCAARCSPPTSRRA